MPGHIAFLLFKASSRRSAKVRANEVIEWSRLLARSAGNHFFVVGVDIAEVGAERGPVREALWPSTINELIAVNLNAVTT